MKISNHAVHPLDDYLGSLVDPTDVYSGNELFLPKELGQLFAEAENQSLEIYSAHDSGLVCPDELEAMKKGYHLAVIAFRSALLGALPDSYRQLYPQDLLQAKIRLMAYEFRVREGVDQPLYADVRVRWKDDGRQESAVIRLNTDRDEDSVLFHCMNLAEFCFLTRENNPHDFVVLDVNRMYGCSYHLTLEEFLTRDVQIQASSPKEAVRELERRLDEEELVLDAEDYRSRAICCESESPSIPNEVRLFAVPDGVFPMTVVERLSRCLDIEAESAQAAKEWVRSQCDQQQLVLDSNDFIGRDLVQHARLVDAQLTQPEEVEVLDEHAFHTRLQSSFPEGVTVSLMISNTRQLTDIKKDKVSYLNGYLNRLNVAESLRLTPLKACLKLFPEDLTLLLPNDCIYQEDTLTRAYNSTVAAVTLYARQHPDLTGGIVKFPLVPKLKEQIFVGSMRLSNFLDQSSQDKAAVGNLKGLSLTLDDDRTLWDRANGNVYESTCSTTISEVRLLHDQAGHQFVRCKIGNEQQSSRRLSSAQMVALGQGKLSLDDLVRECFHDKLKQTFKSEVSSGFRR